MAEVKINPPFGYGEIQALNRHDLVRLYEVGEIPAFAAKSQILPLTFSEFLAASAQLPIVFIQSAGASQLMPVVMTGLGGEQSLFAQKVGKKGAEKWQWDSQVYLPAYVRRHPFCMSSTGCEAKEGDELLVCVEKSHLADKATKHTLKPFDGDVPSERWQMIEQFLQSYQADIELTRQFTEKLQSLALFHSLEANILPQADSEPVSVTGMFGVNEEKLNQLNDAELADLSRSRYLPRIYAHLQSLQNFQKLLNRFQESQIKSSMEKPKTAKDLVN